MSESQLRTGRRVVGVLWLCGVLSFLLPAGSTGHLIGQVLFWALLGSHAIECALYWRSLQATGKPMAGQVLQVILFGVLHYQEVKKELAMR